MEAQKKFPKYILGLLLLLIGSLPHSVQAQDRISQDQTNDVSLQSFYDELSPYGVWINDPDYGRVWRPDVDQDEFRPYYSQGHWEMTQYGNTWVSDYNWGWAPFHYGRWNHNDRTGWVWIPGTTWGPAWVSWRTGGGYYGWAPLEPEVNIHISLGRQIPDFCWVFVPQREIYHASFSRYYASRNRYIMRNTTYINNTYVNNRRTYYTGPRADDIRRDTHQEVRMLELRDDRHSEFANNRSNDRIERGNPGRFSTDHSLGGGYSDHKNAPSSRPERSYGNNNSKNEPDYRKDRIDLKPENRQTSNPVNEHTHNSRSYTPNQPERSIQADSNKGSRVSSSPYSQNNTSPNVEHRSAENAGKNNRTGRDSNRKRYDDGEKVRPVRQKDNK